MIKLDLINFTPISSVIGGLLIGFGIILFFISTGRLAGVSGLVNSILIKSTNRFINILFVIGLILGPSLVMFFNNSTIPFKVTDSPFLIIIGGLLVGIGTRVGSGCTSGHGVIGISLFSLRSILATILFIFSAVITVFILKYIGLT